MIMSNPDSWEPLFPIRVITPCIKTPSNKEGSLHQGSRIRRTTPKTPMLQNPQTSPKAPYCEYPISIQWKDQAQNPETPTPKP